MHYMGTILAAVLQLGCLFLLRVLYRHVVMPYWGFKLFLWSVVLSAFVGYELGVGGLWSGWRVWIVVVLEVFVSIEAIMLATYAMGARVRDSLRYYLAAIAVVPLGIVALGHPELYPGSDPITYYAHLASTLYSTGLLVAGLLWMWGRCVPLGTYTHTGILLVWFTANAATSGVWTVKYWEYSDTFKLLMHIMCIFWWLVSLHPVLSSESSSTD